MNSQTTPEIVPLWGIATESLKKGWLFMIKSTGYTDNTNIHPYLCSDRSLCENWKWDMGGGKERESRGEKKRNVHRGGSWPKLGLNRDGIVHIKSFLNMDSRGRALCRFYGPEWPSHQHALNLHLNYSDCSKANAATVCECVWGEVHSVALTKTSNRKGYGRKHGMFGFARSAVQPRTVTAVKTCHWGTTTRKAQVYIMIT